MVRALLMSEVMKKFLLASKSKSFLERNTNLLQRRGLRLFTATSGEEALKLHKECIFDLILTDIHLEDMDGFTLCSQVRKEDSSKTVPVFLSHHNYPSNKERVEQSGVTAILIKPIDPFELLDTVEKYTTLNMVRSKRVELDVKVVTKACDMELICQSHDISNTGILLETENHIDLGKKVICQFTLPDTRYVEAEGKVMRMSKSESKNLLGVTFITIPSSHRRAIDDYIASSANSDAHVVRNQPMASEQITHH